MKCTTPHLAGCTIHFFYAASALLISKGLNPKTHSGIKSLLNKEFFLTGIIDNQFADSYSLLMAKRHEADYENFAFINPEHIPEYIKKTSLFIKQIEALLDKNQSD